MGKIQVVPVVIDTNVVVSALLFGGVPGEIVTLWKKGVIQPKASKKILDEYIRVLAYPKFDLTEEEIKFLVYHEILAYFDVVTVKSQKKIVKEDPSDDKFIRCAQAAKAHIIISADQYLLKLKSHGKITILTPAQFLEQM
jgi:hypothetical protein